MRVRFSEALLWLSLLALVPKAGRSEGAASYKFQSWQEDDGRIRVDSHYGLAEQSLPGEVKLRLIGLVDTITGATPTGQLPEAPGDPLPTATIDDRRKAWQIEGSKLFGRSTLSVGYAKSRESDYVSDGLAVNTLTEFNQKNTILLLGLAGTRDEVRVFFQPDWEEKRSLDVIAGVTQLLDPKTSVTLNVSYGRGSGYLSDPYKLVQKHVEVGPGLVLLQTFGENRPDEREKWIGYASVNRSFSTWRAAVEASYRLYHDSFGVTSHTVVLEWYQKLWSDRIILRPSLRWYDQSSADFYRVTLDGTDILPGQTPNAAGPFFSSDYRLSAYQTMTYGLKLVVDLLPQRLSIDAAYERYTMDGRDGRTPDAAYVDADVITVGARLSW